MVWYYSRWSLIRLSVKRIIDFICLLLSEILCTGLCRKNYRHNKADVICPYGWKTWKWSFTWNLLVRRIILPWIIFIKTDQCLLDIQHINLVYRVGSLYFCAASISFINREIGTMGKYFWRPNRLAKSRLFVFSPYSIHAKWCFTHIKILLGSRNDRRISLMFKRWMSAWGKLTGKLHILFGWNVDTSASKSPLHCNTIVY